MVLSSALLNNRTWNRHGLKIVWGLGVLFLLAVFALLAFKEYLYRSSKAAEYLPQDLAPISSKHAPAYRVTDITSANLFGDPRPKEKVIENIRDTTLNIKLIGVLWATDPNFARVIIQSGNKKGKLYGIGEDIAGAGASIKEIHSNEILISRNGATEKLPLSKKNSKKPVLAFENNNRQASPPPQVANRKTRGSEAAIQDEDILPEELQFGSSRSTPKPISANGENRKIRRPNFSGLDRALQKSGEI